MSTTDKTNVHQNVLQKFLSFIGDVTGLSWISHILNESDDLQNPPDPENLRSTFEENKTYLNSNQLQLMLSEIRTRIGDDEKRLDKLEAKAFSIININSIITSIIVGVIQFSLGTNNYMREFQICILIIYIVIGLNWFITLMFARRAIQVGKYHYGYANLSTLWNQLDKKDEHVVAEYIFQHIKSYIRNREINNRKANYVMAAQDWFRNTMILLFILLIILGAYPIFNITNSQAVGTPTMSVTNTPSSTPPPTSTNNVVPSATVTFTFAPSSTP